MTYPILPAAHRTVPHFSVIVPIFNAAKRLEATVASVLAQSDGDFELLLIDDGSTDNSLSMMLQLSERDERIHVVSHDNAGVAATRNLGIELSRGPYIAFCDADDLWGKDKLAKHRELHATMPECSASYARIAFIDPDAADNGAAKTYSTVKPGRLSVEDLLGENPVCTTSNLVVKRAVFDEVGCFREGMHFAEDQQWLVRAAHLGQAIVSINAVLVDYRLSEDGLSVNLEQMYRGWREFVSDYQAPAEARSAEALYCRYLARRALRSGARPRQALQFALRGLALDARSFLGDARRGGLTLLAVVLSPLMPRPLRLRLFA